MLLKRKISKDRYICKKKFLNRIRSFSEHVRIINENEIRLGIIQILHEGVRMRRIDSSLTESSKYPELNRMLDSAKSKGETLLISEFVPEIEGLVDKFYQSGQSGGSAPFTAGAIVDTIKKMLAQEPLGDGIECTDDEWVCCGEELYQNSRLSSVFKEGKDGKPYFLDAIIFKPIDKEYTFTSDSVAVQEGGKKKIGSSQYIKSLPFQPKRFIIDVVEKEYKKMPDGSLVEEIGGGWWESWIKDPVQLEEVFKYYEKK